MKRFMRCTTVTICYWVAMFIGPALVLLWNNFAYFFTGAGYGTDSFMYRVLSFFSQPISCFVAAGLAGSLFGGKHKLCTFVNCVVAACYCSAMIFVYLFFVDNASMLGVMIFSTIACTITAVMQANGLVYIDDKEDLKRYKNNRPVSHISIDRENCANGDAILAEPFMPLNILRSHYRDEDGDLVLKMEDGSEYCYYDFPENLYSEMMHSGNPAAFIQRHVRGKYICEKIE